MLYAKSRIDMESPEETALDFSKVPHIAGVPRYMYRSCARAIGLMIRDHFRREPIGAFEHELWVWFFAGILRQRLRDRKQTIDPNETDLNEKGVSSGFVSSHMTREHLEESN